jgi:hypothetical protein
MRILNATEEMSSHPVKNAQWGAKIRLEDTRATKKANLRTGMGLSRPCQEGKSQITAPLTININPNGKSRVGYGQAKTSIATWLSEPCNQERV